MRIDLSLKKYYLPMMYTLEFVLGVLANCTVLSVFFLGRKNWTTGSIYLFNLCLSDFAFLCTLPMLVESYANGIWIYGSTLCKSNRFLLHANLYTSILFLTCISMDRYMIIKYPFQGHLLQNWKMAVCISVSVWILVTAELLPILTFIEPDILENRTLCHSYASSGDALQSLIYSTSLTFLGFIIPLCSICFFYWKILIFLRRRNSLVSPEQAFQKPLRLVISAMVLFSCTFTPYHVMRNVRIASRMESWKLSQCTKVTINAIYVFTRPLAFLNSVINPIFYFMMGDNFREMLMTKLGQLLKSNNTK
ncbi:succinate receptor 1 [Ambystoma mexicanum]|uniref:succinate receptor 1 n=1 Tax=Ambystoma mexicanum TaxID=8296 RepID=UPI0037E8E838